MLSTESRRGRRILARLDRGMELFDGVRALCQKYDIRCGELRGIGSLELAELAAFDQGARRWKPARVVTGGGLELLHLHGTISEERGAVSIQAQATLMRDRDAGLEVIGGFVQRAVVYSVELVIETFDDVLLRRQTDPATGLSRWAEALAESEGPALSLVAPVAAAPAPAAAAPAPAAAATAATPSPVPVRPAPTPSPTPSPMPSPTQSPTRSGPAPAPATATVNARPVRTATPALTWADVASASQPAAPPRPSSPEPEPREEDVFLNAGDVILHPRFQRCVVHRVEGSGEFVQVMLRNGRVVRLSLEVLRLTPQGVENGQRIFAVTVL
jgi:predicted DNA-binding protein with PD1-like motif